MGMLEMLAAVNEAIFPVPVNAEIPIELLVCDHIYSVPITEDPSNVIGKVEIFVQSA
jgi:hypothetical protein